jgi:hypothetical protein
VLSELPQLGQQPSSRMYHRAAVDPEAGVMYVYGGVHIRDLDGARLPADQAAGTLHCYCFHTYTWSTLQTTGGKVFGTQLHYACSMKQALQHQLPVFLALGHTMDCVRVNLPNVTHVTC